MSACFSTICPLGVFSLEIMFCCLCWMVSLWKYLMFLSPSFNHVCRDFYLHNISSCLSRSANSWINYPSLILSSSVYMSLIIPFWISPINVSNWIFSSIMLPKVSLFHIFRWFFMCFSFYWNTYIRDPSSSINTFHHSAINCLKFGCVI